MEYTENAVNAPVYELEIFSGPLELLLKLVTETKIPISEVRLADVTDQFISYMERAERFNITLASEFTVMAAKLLYIKSLSLLPARRRAEETEEEGDPEEILRARLIEYKLFKNVCAELDARYGVFSRRGYRLPTEDFGDNEYVPEEAEAAALRDALMEMLNKTPVKKTRREPRKILREPYTVEERMEELLRSFETRKKYTFELLFADCVTRSELVVSFLALLELMNNGYCAVDNDEPGKIYIRALKRGE